MAIHQLVVTTVKDVQRVSLQNLTFFNYSVAYTEAIMI